jgi:hypothetical protein
MGGLTALTSLILRDCEQMSDDGLQALADLLALTSLNFKRCGQA